MKTVLGLSVTAAGVGWVLVDGTTPVDDDNFVVRTPGDLVPRCLAAVRGAQSIAASSGRRIDSIGVCWSQDVEEQVLTLLAELRAAGCPDVRSVRQVTPPANDAPPTERTERTDLCGLLAGLLADDAETDDDETAFVELDVICGPDAGQTPAYGAAQAVVTDMVPAEPVLVTHSRRSWVPEWTPAVSGARLVSAAAVTAVVALFAVGSQFVGTREQQPGQAALAGSTSAPTAQTTQVVPQQPPAVQPMAALPEPTPLAEVNEPPVQQAPPQPQPVAETYVPVAAPVSAEPLTAPQLPVPDAVQTDAVPVPVAPLAVPEQAAPGAAPVAPPEVLPPAPPLPFWLMPPFVPAPPPPVVAPAPEALAAPVEHLPPPAPVAPAPVDPVFGALP